MQVTLTRITGDPILAIEEAASNCYDSTPSQNGVILDHCVKSGHTSVTEFCNFTFHIEGVSRALLAQLTRHRHAGYAVRSQRYCAENGFGYVTPPSIHANPEAEQKYIKCMEELNSIYQELQRCEIPNEDARYVLPNACSTVVEVTMNLRALMNFMNERLCRRAQWEIRELATIMKKLIVEEVPKFEKYLVPKCEKYGKEVGFCPESPRNTCHRYPRLANIFHNNLLYLDYLETIKTSRISSQEVIEVI